MIPLLGKAVTILDKTFNQNGLWNTLGHMKEKSADTNTQLSKLLAIITFIDNSH